MNSKATLLFLASWMLILSELQIVAQVQQAWVARYSGTASPSYDHAFALAVDDVGNIYVTGDASSAGGTGGFATVKYDTNGTQRWVARYNGGVAEALAVDNAGNVYVAGQVTEDYTVVKYNSAGSQQWAARYNGPANLEDHPTALKVDNAGYVYVTGYSASAGDRNDYATVKYNASGVRLWVARYDGPGNYDDHASALAVDSVGNVYVTGFSYTSDTGYDYATVKYGPTGNQLWVARYIGPEPYTGQFTAEDTASAIAVDSIGNVYVTGTSRGENGPEYATVKYSASGVQLWVARYHGPIGLSSSASALAVDSAGNIHVTGVSDAPGSGYDYATIKYDTAGHQLWVARYNSSNWYSDAPNALALDGTGNVYVTGWSGLGQGVSPDYATVKYDPNGNQIWVARYNGPESGYDEAQAVAVDGAGSVFVTGYSAGTGGGFDYATVKYVQTAVAGLPAVTTQPQSQVVVAGNEVMFSVLADGAAPLSFQWRFNGANIPDATNTTLNLGSVQPENDGEYSVTARNAAGFTATPEARLTVYFPPAISVQPYSHSVFAGDNIGFYIVADGRPAPAYQWQWNGIPLPDATNASLSLSNVIGSQAGDYTVVVSNVAGVVTSSAAVLNVIEEAPDIIFQTQSQHVLDGDPIYLTVFATGHPSPTYQWRFNGLDLPGATNSSLTLPNATSSKAGNYTGVVSNYVGVVTSSVIVITVIQTAPKILIQPVSQTGLVGASVTISIAANGSPPPAFQWWFNGQRVSGGTNASLVLSNLTINSAGQYFTVVSNVAGSVTSTVATLTMFYPGPLDRWQERPSPVQGQVGLKAVIYANRLFVAVGDYGTILTSANAVNWSLHHDGLPFPSLLQSIGWGNNLFVAVGSRGGIATSIDGANWTPRNTGTLADLYSVAYGNGTFVAVGGYYDSTILTSHNGVNWTNRNAGDALTFRAVAYGNGRFVAVGYARVDLPGRILTSMDGITWSIEGNLEPTMTLYGIGFGRDRFVSVGSVYLGSTAGYMGLAAAWAATNYSQVLQNSSSLSAVAYGGGTFLAVGSDGVILSSTDGYSWKGWHSGTSTYLTGVAYGNGTFVVVTSRGTILQSGYTPVILSGRSFSSGSGFEVTARGGIDGIHRFQATSSLAMGDWTDLGTYSVTYTNPQALTQFLDTNAPNLQQRFYRAVSP